MMIIVDIDKILISKPNINLKVEQILLSSINASTIPNNFELLLSHLLTFNWLAD